MKEMLSKAFNWKKNYPNFFLVNNKKNYPQKNDLTVFEPNAPLRGYYGIDTVPLSQTSTFNIKFLKWDLKDSPICLD